MILFIILKSQVYNSDTAQVWIIEWKKIIIRSIAELDETKY
jgi:hypothetical protein